jgi:hypothetical protein
MSASLQIKLNEDRAPEVEALRDGRHKVTRFYKIAHRGVIPAELNLAKGTADSGAWGWTNAPRLTDILLTDTAPRPGMESHPWVQLVYEELPATAEIPIGVDDISYDEAAFKNITAEFMQFSTGTFTPGTVGTSTYSGDATCVLKRVDDEDDGTVRVIKRLYVNGGTLSQTDETKEGGALLIRTIVSVNAAPATPSGYTLIVQKQDNKNGFKTYTYTFAKGLGQFLDASDVKEGGKLVVYHRIKLGGAPTTPSATIGGTVTLISSSVRNDDGNDIYDYTWAEGFGEVSRTIEYHFSADAGTTGVTQTTIRYLTAAGVTTDPTSAPSGAAKISSDPSPQDGYVLWTAVYAKGTGTVTSTVETRNGGKLVIYSKVAIGSAPSAPAATIGGTVTAIKTEQRNGSRGEDGVVVYDYSWAEGFGEIDRAIDYIQSSDAGTTGITRTTIRHLTAVGASDPTSAPSGTAKVSSQSPMQDGYLLWTVVYAKGVGTVITETEKRNQGKLVVYHLVGLGSAPSAPAATIGGTVVSTSTEVRESEGHKIYDYRWAEGLGVIAEEKIPRPDGLLEWHRTILSNDTLPITTSTFDTSWIPTVNAVLLHISPRLQDGYTITEALWMVAGDGTSAPTAATVATEAWMPFRYPGRAKYFTQTVSAGGTTTNCYDVYLSPPIEVLVLATTTITYQTTTTVGTLANTLWNPTGYATMIAKFGAWGPAPRSIVKAFEGYTAVNTGSSGTSGGSGLDTSVLGERVYASSGWSIALDGGPTLPSGATVYTLHAEVEKQAAFVKYDGTKYYRKIIITATPAAMPSLPV